MPAKTNPNPSSEPNELHGKPNPCLSRFTRLIFIRHGITDWNLQKRYQGHTDIPLNDTGRVQSHRTAEKLVGIPIEVVYSSDLCRAFETAQITCAGRHLTIHKNKELRETNYGVWEGLTLLDIQEKYPELLEKATRDPLHTQYTHGESRGMMLERVGKAISRIIDLHPGKSIAIISHEGAIAAMVCTLLGKEFIHHRREYRLDNTAYHILEQTLDGAWTVIHKGQKSEQASDKT